MRTTRVEDDEPNRASGGVLSPRAQRLVLFCAVFAISLARMLPARLVSEEPTQFWAKVPTVDPLTYLALPWGGYLQVPARAVFLVAYEAGALGPLLTRLCAAAVIALVAVFLASDRLSGAIPDARVRWAFALSLALLPIKNPYVGPLNSQWWLALLAVGIALAPPRRGDIPLLAISGLSGLAPLLAIPTFRDRRVVGLVLPLAIHGAFILMSERRPRTLEIRPEFVFAAIGLVVAMAVARLPLRTRSSLVLVGLATIALGSVAIVRTDGGLRYLTVAWAGISLGALSYLPGVVEAVRRHPFVRRARMPSRA